MSAADGPFAPRVQVLGRCVLHPLPENAAPAIAQALAAIDPWRGLGYGDAALESYLLRADPALHRFEIRAENTTAGVVCVRHPWLRGPYLELIGLKPSYQGSGAGSATLAWFEAGAARLGGNAWVVVSAFNERARAFYARRGYAPVGALPGLVTEGFDEILLRKRLPSPFAP